MVSEPSSLVFAQNYVICILCKYSYIIHAVESAWQCLPCPRNYTADGVRPTAETFDKYLPSFLRDLPSTRCPKGGRAAYANVIVYFSPKFIVINITILLCSPLTTSTTQTVKFTLRTRRS